MEGFVWIWWHRGLNREGRRGVRWVGRDRNLREGGH